MRVLDVVGDREALLNELVPTGDHPSRQFVAQIIHNFTNLYRVEIGYETTRSLLLNSSLSNPSLPIGEYPTLESVVAEALENPLLLSTVHGNHGLSGQRVSYYIAEHDRFQNKVEDFMLVDKWVNMPSYGSLYVGDGMHRLVAYGIWRGGVEKLEYPLYGYYGTNKEFP